jgi:Na+/proline symporter
MSRAEAILYTLVVYKIVLVGIGLWATRRTRDAGDFFLGGRRLGAWVAAISASASSSSAWTLVAVSGMAYLWGWPALWLFPATVSGFMINWLWVAPRLMRASRAQGAITLTEFLAGPEAAHGWPRRVVCSPRRSCCSLSLSTSRPSSRRRAAPSPAPSSSRCAPPVAIGAAVVLLYTLLGGFWAVSVTDTLQGLVMALTALVLPVAAVSRPAGRARCCRAGRAGARAGRTPDRGIAAVGFVLGTLGIGLGYPGQPHVVNRFMALRDPRALRDGAGDRAGWAVIIYAGMLTVGLAARALYGGLLADEQVLFEVANRLFAPVVAGVMIAAVLSAIMSTADSQLLVAASSVSHDLPRRGRGSLAVSRLVVALISVLAVVVALLLPQTIFARVLFAWTALGAAFGPPLLVRLAGFELPPRTGVRGHGHRLQRHGVVLLAPTRPATGWSGWCRSSRRWRSASSRHAGSEGRHEARPAHPPAAGGGVLVALVLFAGALLAVADTVLSIVQRLRAGPAWIYYGFLALLSAGARWRRGCCGGCWCRPAGSRRGPSACRRSTRRRCASDWSARRPPAPTPPKWSASWRSWRAGARAAGCTSRCSAMPARARVRW